MSERIWCLDTSVVIKYLTPDEQEEAATRLVIEALTGDVRLVAPPWAWAEVGSVLRKKIRSGLLTSDEAETLFDQYRRLPIDEVHGSAVPGRAWELAARLNLPTLYDAAFLAVVELVSGLPGSERVLWTADRRLLDRARPAHSYVKSLDEFSAT